MSYAKLETLAKDRSKDALDLLVKTVVNECSAAKVVNGRALFDVSFKTQNRRWGEEIQSFRTRRLGEFNSQELLKFLGAFGRAGGDEAARLELAAAQRELSYEFPGLNGGAVRLFAETPGASKPRRGRLWRTMRRPLRSNRSDSLRVASPTGAHPVLPKPARERPARQRPFGGHRRLRPPWGRTCRRKSRRARPRFFREASKVVLPAGSRLVVK